MNPYHWPPERSLISSGPGNSETVLRQVRDNDCGEHNHASDDFSDRHHFPEQYHSCNQGEYRLKAEYHRRDGRLGFLLSKHLQGERDAAGHDARIENGKPGTADISN